MKSVHSKAPRHRTNIRASMGPPALGNRALMRANMSTTDLLVSPPQPAACTWAAMSVTDWSSVAQAIAATVAIFAAVWIASRQFRQQVRFELARERRKALVAAETIRVLAERYTVEVMALHALVSQTASEEELHGVIVNSAPAELFRTVENGAAALPLHELQDPEAVELLSTLLNNIRTTRLTFERLHRQIEQGQRSQFFPQVFTQNLKAAKVIRETARANSAALKSSTIQSF